MMNKVTMSRYNNRRIPFNDLDISNFISQKIKDALYKSLKELGYHKFVSKSKLEVLFPSDDKYGDYCTNVPLLISSFISKKPEDIAKDIANKIILGREFECVQALGGFINFKLSKESLISDLKKIIDDKQNFGKTKLRNEYKILIEFGQPNTHKMPHIGHLFSYCFGESICRLISFFGFKLFRANYQGDVGLHVAKCLWAYKKLKPKIPAKLVDKANLLQYLYQEGARAYDKDEIAKNEIDKLNIEIYHKSPSIYSIWEKTRNWSVSFYRNFEKMLGVFYDRYYYESETAGLGKKIVKENVNKVFKKSQGAIIFEGSKYGFHDRVFVTKKGTPTYEAKDLALQELKYKEFPFDFMIITTANEQNEYFNVVFKALEILSKKFVGKLSHFGFGMIRLKTGKMSSREGNIITGVDLIEKSIGEIKNIIKERSNLTKNEKDKIAKIVGIGAIKYSFLKSNPLKDIVFDFEESLSFDGNSAPYIQYTYARAKSILKKLGINKIDFKEYKDLNQEEISILRMLHKFPAIVLESGLNLNPSQLCTYLYNLAQRFNTFYKKHSVMRAKENEKSLRLAITAATLQVIEKCLYLLGIEVPEKM